MRKKERKKERKKDMKSNSDTESERHRIRERSGKRWWQSLGFCSSKRQVQQALLNNTATALLLICHLGFLYRSLKETTN